MSFVPTTSVAAVLLLHQKVRDRNVATAKATDAATAAVVQNTEQAK